MFQSDPGLAEIKIKTSQLLYRYLSTKSDFTYTKSGYSSEDSESSVETSSNMMTMSEDVDDLNPGEKSRLLISLVDDIHDCVEIMQNRSLHSFHPTLPIINHTAGGLCATLPLYLILYSLLHIMRGLDDA